MKTIFAIGALFLLLCCGHSGGREIAFNDISPRGYAQSVEVPGANYKTVYISGQVSVDSRGEVIGEGNLEQQTTQVFENIKVQLTKAGGTMKDLVSIDCYFTDLSGIAEFRMARDKYINLENPPASTAVQVERLVNEKFLIEISAIAVVRTPQ